MANFNINKANFCARMSCRKWNKIRLSRQFYRSRYRQMAQQYWESEKAQEKISEYQAFHAKCASIEENAIWNLIDTYPLPYSHPEFANWEEDDSEENYSLISDQSGCIVKYATSYVAWKIFEATGTWPQKTSKERLDAKRWVQFLTEAGYTTIVSVPSGNGYFVGIDPKKGEFGTVVWYEGTTLDHQIISTTYKNKTYTISKDGPADFIWVKIK